MLARRPALLVELVEQNATRSPRAVAPRLSRRARRNARTRTVAGIVPAANAVFVQPWQLSLLSRRDSRRAFSARSAGVPTREFDQLDARLAARSVEPQAA